MRYLPLHPGSAEAIVMLEAARVQGTHEPVMAAVLEAQPDWHDGKMDAAWAAAEKAGPDVAKDRAIATPAGVGGRGHAITGARRCGASGQRHFFFTIGKQP